MLEILGYILGAIVVAWSLYDNIKSSPSVNATQTSNTSSDDSNIGGYSPTDASTDPGYIGVFSDDD